MKAETSITDHKMRTEATQEDHLSVKLNPNLRINSSSISVHSNSTSISYSTEATTFTNSCSLTTTTYMPSSSFKQSYTFTPSSSFKNTDTYIQSNSFIKSSTYVQLNSSLSNNTYLYSSITFIVSLTNSFSIIEHITNTLITTHINIHITYISTQLVFYDYTFLQYSTIYSFYSDFFTFYDEGEIAVSEYTLSETSLIGIICGSVVGVLLIIGIVVFLIRNHKGRELSTNSSENEEEEFADFEKVDEMLHENAMQDKDQWI